MTRSPRSPRSPRRLSTVAMLVLLGVLGVMGLLAGCTARAEVATANDEAAAGGATASPATAATAAEPTAAPEPDPTAAPAPDPTAEPDPTPAPAPSAGGVDVVVTLLDPGAEPRIPLRLDLDAACGETMTMSQVQEISQTVGGLDTPSSGAVGTIVTMATESSPLGDDRFLISMEVTSAEAAPDTPGPIRGLLNGQLEPMLGLSTSVEVTSRAVPIEGTASLVGAEALGPLSEMVESMNSQIANPLPEEPIGIGGSWETVNTLELQGMTVTQTTVQTVVDIDGSIITLDTVATQTVPDGAVMSAFGFEAPVVAWENDTRGSVVLDLGSFVPVRSSTTVDAFQVFEIDGDSLEQEISIQMDVTGDLGSTCSPRAGRDT